MERFGEEIQGKENTSCKDSGVWLKSVDWGMGKNLLCLKHDMQGEELYKEERRQVLDQRAVQLP